MTARNINIPYATLVRRADPEHDQKKVKEVEYEFSNGRKFTGNPSQRGAYADDED